jgi:pimeloyl-ACP methyl ester carboxylesterase
VKAKFVSRWKWIAALLLAVAALLLYAPAKDAALAVRLILTLRQLADGSAGQNLAVTVARVRHRYAGKPVEAILYRPSGYLPGRAALLVPGISEQGVNHPRLVALSRALADKGFFIVTPDIEAFRRFRIEPERLDELTFWFQTIGELAGSERVDEAGIAGVSFSGTLALMAAAQPELRDRVDFVFAIGAYADLHELSATWFAADPSAGNGRYPTRFYAKWIVMLEALPLLQRSAERDYLRRVLTDLLLERKPPGPPEGTSDQARSWYEFALTGAGDTGEKIVEYLTPRLFEKLNPARAARLVRCPVFLVHGAYDDLIPPEQSRRLSRMLRAPAHVLVTPFLTHTHPGRGKLSRRDQLYAALDMFVFLYRFIRGQTPATLF